MSIKNTNTNSPLIEPFSSCSKKLFSRKGSFNSEIEIFNLPLKIPQKVLHLFNSISDFYNNKNISDAIKELKNVKDRLILIDLILKRRNEVNQIEELSQITKLRPLFEKIKNRFKKNMNKSTISPSLNTIKSPETNKGDSPSLPRSPTLFIPNSIDPRNNPKRISILNAVTSFNSRNNKKELNNDQIEKIKSGVKAIETNFPFIDVKNIEKSHLINPFKTDHDDNKEKFKNFKGTRRNSFCTSNNPFREKLEKDIYKVFVKNKLSTDFFENEKFSLGHKNLTLIENDVLNIINKKTLEKNIKKTLDFPSFAFKRKKEEKKKIMSFHNINKKKSLKIFKNVPEGDNDDSFASYTEVKLDQLYKASWTINQQLKHLEINGIGDQNTHIKELKIKKNDELTKTQREIHSIIDKKLSKNIF